MTQTAMETPGWDEGQWMMGVVDAELHPTLKGTNLD